MFTPPARQSMSDSELQEALGAAHANEAGILAAMELLERQSALREIDDRSFQVWVDELTAIGTPQALHAIENAKRINSGLEPIDFNLESPESDSETAQTNSFDVDATSVVENIPASADATSQLNSTSAAHDDFAESLNRLYADQAEAVAQVVNVRANWAEPEAQVEHVDALQAEVKPEVVHFDNLRATEEELEVQVDAPSEGAQDSSSLDDAQSLAEEVVGNEVIRAYLPIVDTPEPVAQQIESKRLALTTILRSVGVFGGGASILLAIAVNALASNFATAATAIAVGVSLSGLVSIAFSIAHHRSGRSSLEVSRAAFGVIGNVFPAFAVSFARVIVIAAVLFGGSVVAIWGHLDDSLSSQTPLIAGICAVLVTAVGAIFARVSGKSIVTLMVAAAFSVLSFSAFIVLQPAPPKYEVFVPGSVQWPEVFMLSAAIFALYVAIISPITQDVVFEKVVFLRKLPTLTISVIVVPVFVALSALFATYVFEGVQTSSASDTASIMQISIAGSVAIFLGLVLLAAFVFKSLTDSIGAMVPKLAESSRAAIVMLSTLFAIGAFSLTWLGAQGLELLEFIASAALIPIIAWAGIFAADTLLRRVAYHDVSLVRSYGFYKPFNFVSILGWLIAVLFGFSVLRAPEGIFGSVGGFGFALLPDFALQLSSSGVTGLLVFAISFAVPVVFGIPRVRSQEREVLALEARRDDLKDIFRFGE